MTPPGNRRDAATAALLALLVVAAKLPTLGVPYLWDETVWIGGAHWLADGSLLRAVPHRDHSVMFGGHPAGLALLTAALFKVFGPSVELAHLLIAAFAALGVAGTYLLGARLFGRAAGLLAALFLFASPMYFAQAGMFLGDLPVTALGVTAAWLAVTRRWAPYVVASILLVWVKETGVAVAAAIAIHLLVAGRRPADAASAAGRAGDPVRHLGWRPAIAYGAPPFLAAVAFFVWQKIQTGSFCCIYGIDFDLFESSSRDYLPALSRVLSWILVEQGRWALAALAVAHLALRPDARRRSEWVLLALVPLFFAVSFARFYYLPRYSLPTLPFLCLAAAWSLVALVRVTWARVASGAAVIGLFLSSWFATDPPGTYEWNLRYLDVVRNQQAIYAVLLGRSPEARVLSVWPHTVQLLKPRLEYVTKPLDVVGIADAVPGDGCERVLVTFPPGRGERVGAYLSVDRFSLVRRIEGAGPIVAELYEAKACSQRESARSRRALSERTVRAGRLFRRQASR